MNHQIYSLPLSKLEKIEPFLEFLTTSETNAGKKTENYWIINTQANLNEDGTPEIHFFNAFLHQCRARGYSSVMILNQ